MSERELLQALFDIVSKQEIVIGQEDSIRDMVQRYQHPPLSLVYRCCMRLKVQQVNELNLLLVRISHHLKGESSEPAGIDLPESVGDVSPHDYAE